MGTLYLPFDEILADWPKVRFWDGWRFRGRSTGGFDSKPLAVTWHHTASGSQTDQRACEIMISGLSYSPVANIGIGSDGTIHVMAGGACNTTGSSRGLKFSRGTVLANTANTKTVGMEIINAGDGADLYPEAQIDAAFWANNEINNWCENQPGDLATHNYFTLFDPAKPAGMARKVDPSTASAVQGRWRPVAVPNGSGSWDNKSVVAEATRRADEEIDMTVNYQRIRRIVAEELEKNNAETANAVWNRRIAVHGDEGATQPARWFLNRTQRIARFWLGSPSAEAPLPTPGYQRQMMQAINEDDGGE